MKYELHQNSTMDLVGWNLKFMNAKWRSWSNIGEQCRMHWWRRRAAVFIKIDIVPLDRPISIIHRSNLLIWWISLKPSVDWLTSELSDKPTWSGKQRTPGPASHPASHSPLHCQAAALEPLGSSCPASFRPVARVNRCKYREKCVWE